MDNMLKESKKWDYKFSLKFLMENNNICMIDRKEDREHSYQGPLIYFKNPETGKYSIQVGILDDGFFYRADREVEDLPKGNPKELMKELYLYRKYKNKKVNNMRLEKKYESKFKEKIVEDLLTIDIDYSSSEWRSACHYYDNLLPVLKDTIIHALLMKKTNFLIELDQSTEKNLLTFNYLLNKVFTTLKVDYGFDIKDIEFSDKKINIKVEIQFK